MFRPFLLLLACAACRCGVEDSGRDSRTDWYLPDNDCVSDVSISFHDEMVTLATVSWTQEPGWDAVWIDYGLDGEESLAAWPDGAEPGPRDQVLLGLPAASEFWWQFACSALDTTLQFELFRSETDALPDPALQPNLETWDPSTSSDAPWLIGSIEAYDDAYYDGPYWQFVLDRRGRVVWYRALPDGLSSTFPRPSRDGTHVVTERVDRFGLAGDQPAVIHRMTLDLTQQNELEIPGLRFGWDEDDSGAIVYYDRDVEREGWLSRFTPSGGRERIFDCVSWIADRCTESWCCEANAIVWDAPRGTALYSTWATHSVLEVDLASGEVLHQWGQLEGSWDFDPESANFELQHYPNFTAEGTLLVSTHVPDQLSQQRVREFELDEQAQVLRQIWSHGEGQDLYAQYQGEAVRLPNGNTLINYGTEGVIHEVTSDGQLSWSLAWDEPWMLGHTTLVEDLWALNEGPVP